MTPDSSLSPRAVAGKARDAVAKLRPGDATGSRSLPIRRSPEEIRRVWDDPAARTAVLEGLPPGDATIEVGADQGDWGITVTLRLELERATPDMATQILAGKAVRRLKAMAETGEVPTTAHNPSARADAGEEDA